MTLAIRRAFRPYCEMSFEGSNRQKTGLKGFRVLLVVVTVIVASLAPRTSDAQDSLWNLYVLSTIQPEQLNQNTDYLQAVRSQRVSSCVARLAATFTPSCANGPCRNLPGHMYYECQQNRQMPQCDAWFWA
ncbi:MAG: hypothetical protein ACU0FH_08705 [Heliomarina sp.]|uniref:hypothetical protein n=1 Tax=Heliomarina sp. TaxID=2917556 RepID=UPI0040597BA6